MQKKLIALLCASLLCVGCTGQKNPSEEEDPTSNGPVVQIDERTPEEKELAMIQSCVEDYNTDQIAKREEYYMISIPELPIGITKLPEVKSMKDLEEIPLKEYEMNIAYKGKMNIGENYDVVYTITDPTGGAFWINGYIQFEIDPKKVKENDPQFASVRSQIQPLIEKRQEVLDDLCGINVEYDMEHEQDGYYPIVKMNNQTPSNIEQMKQLAESVFTKEFLEERYYPNCFDSEHPTYKMIGNQLYGHPTDLQVENQKVIDPRYIVAAKESKDGLRVDVLYRIMDQLQPVIKTFHFVKTEAGYRLPQDF